VLLNLRVAVRSLRKSPAFTIIVVLILAVGIGGNIAIFSLFHQLMLRSLPVPEPERLVSLSAPGLKPGATWIDVAGSRDDFFSYPMFRDLERAQEVFTGIAAQKNFNANLAYKGKAVNGQAVLVSGSYFPVLGTHPALGRLIGPADDARPGAAEVAVLSYDYWVSQFAGRVGVLDETLVVNGRPLTIVGVAPRGFQGTVIGAKPEVFVPLTLKELVDSGGDDGLFDLDPTKRSRYWLSILARLKPGVSLARARAQINLPYHALINDVEAKLPLGLSPQALVQFRAREIGLACGQRGQSQVRTSIAAPLELLQAVTALVLLIACANIANLLLARGVARSGEIALRVSLGATARQIVLQLLTESCLLAACGGVLSVVFAGWTLHLILALMPDDFTDKVSLTLDGAALLLAMTLSLGAGLLIGLLPALHSVRGDLRALLKGQGGSMSDSRGAVLVRDLLIASQTAMAMMLLVAAGLLIESLSNISRVDVGLNLESLVTFRISPVLNGYTPERSQALFQRLEDELERIPGVDGITAAELPILGGSNMGRSVSVEGYTKVPEELANGLLNKIDAGYFRVLGVPLLAGREFTRGDSSGSGRVALVNEEFVRRFKLGHDAIGRWMSGDGSDKLDIRIIGVVRNAKYSEVKEATLPQFFLPYRQDETIGSLSFYVRSALRPERTLALATQAVARLDPNLPIEAPKTLARQFDESISLDRLMGVLCVAFAALATFLAVIGLYGVLAYAVTRRTREFGVRMALGAQPRRIAWPVVRDALRLASIGVVVGGLGAVALTRWLGSILFGVAANDPTALIGSGILLILVASMVAWIPAWRASRIDPMIALRAQ
jgi:putative ABC transport system permease protein